jgi:hypothetical protein
MRFLILALPFLIAASAQTPADSPPPALTPYIQNGAFKPGDFHWLRGQFDGANAADKAADASIQAWRKRCRASDLKETRAELASMGIHAGASLDSMPYHTLICDQVATLPEPLDLRDWNGFERDVATVRPIAQAFLAAVDFSEAAAQARTPALGDLLRARVVGEQALRQGLAWANGAAPDTPSPSLTPQQRGILVSEIAMAMAARDHANTELLKRIVAAQGWPTRSKVGDSGSDIAWLLVQHADADPAFQARALRLMEPLVATGEVNSKNYAYLYDRVMLKLVGKQRYATQMTCRAGRYVPEPVEDDRKVEELRRAVGLDTLSDYEQRMIKAAGPCTSTPTGS